MMNEKKKIAKEEFKPISFLEKDESANEFFEKTKGSVEAPIVENVLDKELLQKSKGFITLLD
jgi:hypothetical protein